MGVQVVLCCFLLWFGVQGELSHQLKYYETLKHVDVRTRTKRSTDGHSPDTKEVSFSALGRKFDMVLTPGSPVLASDFKASVVRGDGSSSPLYVNSNEFFTGHLSDERSVEVDAHTEDGLWSASIYDKNEIYTIEPSWRHLPPSDNHSLIAYRHSDIKWDNTFPHLKDQAGKRQKICNSIYPDEEDEEENAADPPVDPHHNSTNSSSFEGHSRQKRSARNTCHIIAVADYTFFYGPGGGFPHRTANYLIDNMQKVDRIYRNTKWDSTGYDGMGFQIRELRIHPEHTQTDWDTKHYNMRLDTWVDKKLLQQFGMDPAFHNFCLAHLFTHRQFSGGVLGLAYIASPRRRALGGICSRGRMRQAMNIGFSSSMNTKGGNLLTQEAVLVTTHEFGHNWGAEHDAETDECAPSSFDQGKYIMYPYAVSGYEDNNDKFSPCSKRYISAVLQQRSSLCFKRLSNKVPMCGNGFIDKGEDCDGGGLGLSGLDSCCSDKCKFIGDAKCSPVNYECCENCRMAPNGTLCRGENFELCQKSTTCTGLSLDCPTPEPLNDTDCIDQGRCFEGQCLTFCEVEGKKYNINLEACRCEQDRTAACRRCCRNDDGVCQQYGGSLPNGRPCAFGYCENGYCKTVEGRFIQRLFNFIEDLDASTLVAFMKSNIVGTIIVFSLIVWIPASWTVSCIDKRREKKEEMYQKWSSQSHNFIHWNDDDIRIRQSTRRYVRNPEVTLDDLRRNMEMESVL